MASKTGSSPQSRISPRKFSEKIALLNKKEREANEKFDEIIKEVQATVSNTKQQHPQPVTQQSNDSSCGLSILQDELQSISTNGILNYKGVHADSLEEIEKVYENLMKSVGQYDDNNNNNQENHEIQRQKQVTNHTHDTQNVHNVDIMYRPNSRSSSAGPAKRPLNNAASFTVSPASSSTFYQSAVDGTTNSTDLNRQHLQTVHVPSAYVPTSLEQPSKNNSSELDICASTSCITQQQQSTQHTEYSESLQSDASHRARVLSFGSVSRQKYPCATNNMLNQDSSQESQSTYYQIQYLKEPSGDRSRQKSISDPQLHISPNLQHQQQQMIAESIASCRSDNRLTVTSDQAGILNTQAGMSCCVNSNPKRFQILNEGDYNLEYNSGTNMTSNYISPAEQVAHAHHNKPLATSTIKSLQAQFCLVSNKQHQDHLYEVCDTTSSRGQLPNIKICGIEDESNSFNRIRPNDLGGNVCTPNSDASSRDGSLPDIANLRFNNGSQTTSPERCIYQKLDWSHDDINRDQIPNSNSSQRVVANWTSYGDSNTENVDMEVQIDSSSEQNTSMNSNLYNPQQASLNQTTVTAPSHNTNPLCWASNPHTVGFSGLPKVDNSLSHSDCGFDIPAHHHQQGSLMISTSSDLYNNIMRSRSHNNISTINQVKHPQHYQINNLQQFEQHYVSQRNLQAGQPVMNVQRIEELKTYGTSTSPLDSSSNLNSPQSESNSPGSSTTEQVEMPLLLAGSTNEHHEYYSAPESLTGSSSTTLVSDGIQFHSQYVPTTMPYSRQLQHDDPPPDTNFQSSACESTSLQQQASTAAQVYQTHNVQQNIDFTTSQQSLSVACSQNTHIRTITPATSTSMDSNNRANNPNVTINHDSNNP